MLAGPLLARSQSYFSQGSVSEYVEDSEPEREERRIKEKTRRKKKRPEVLIPPAEVIELTDSDASYHAGGLPPVSPKAQPKPMIVIDILDSSDAAPPQTASQPSAKPSVYIPLYKDESSGLPELEGTTTDDSLPSFREMFKLPQRAPQAGPSSNANLGIPRAAETREVSPAPQAAQPLSPSKSANGSGDEEEGALKLGRFAYAAPARRTASKTPSPTDSVPPEARLPAKGKQRAATHRFADDFSDAQLARVLKCVSCELAWTTRKTVAQKMKHIQTCAKKNGLSDETVRTLLRKELDSLPPVASSSSSKAGTPAPAPEAALPETLLEEVLKDAQKKKPGRRPQVLQTVKSVTDTRGTILDRARSLLQKEGPSRASSSSGTPSPADVGLPPATQMFSRSNFATREDAPQHLAADTTQAFGRSRLAGPSRLQGAIVRAGAEIAAQSDVSPLTQVPSGHTSGAVPANVDGDEAELPPPSTQVFARSKLTNVGGVTRRVVTAAADIPDEPISIHDTSSDDLTRASSPPKPSAARASPSPGPNTNGSSPTRSRRTTSPRPRAAGRSPSPRSPSPAGDGGASPSRLAGDPVTDVYEYEEHWDEWIRDDVWDDGACLHYVPEPVDAGMGVAGPSGLQAQDKQPSLPAPSLSPLQRRLATLYEDALGPPAEALDAAAAEPPPPAKKKRGRRKKAVEEGSDADAEGADGKAADVSQDELNAKMKAAILADGALHLRILRYEPIHFDVFLQMAVALGMPEKRSGLKGKVRAFLDQKAIHFYGADPSKSRTKRTRHP